MRHVNIHDAKTHFSRLVEDVNGGEEIVIARNGKPVAKLVPFQPAPAGAMRRKREMGWGCGLIAVTDDFDAPLPDGVLRQFGVLD
jgi:prevent-host-death family protein